jgi:hypothetical protein
MLTKFLRKFRERKARRRLAEIVAQTRARPNIQLYAARRAAARKGWKTRRAGA